MRARLFVCRPRPHRSHPHTPANPHPGAPHFGFAGPAAFARAAYAGCGEAPHRPRGTDSAAAAHELRADGGTDGGPFGVRRPLRFLAERLGLNEAQVKEMARIIDDLKTERAQAEVDQRRTLAAFADAVLGGAFDEARAAEGADLRLRNAERLRAAVLDALRKIHALLSETQREQLAYMIRTGTLVL